MIDPISKIIGTDINNIKVIEDFLDENSFNILLNFTKEINSKLKTKDHHVYQPLPFEISEIFNKYKIILKEKAEGLYGLDFINDGNEVCLFVHPEGSSMQPHTDIVEVTPVDQYSNTDFNNLDSIRKSGEDLPFHWTGHLASLIYLNDNYDGGELYFPDKKISIKPKPKMLVMFPGNDYYIHGVAENKNNTRFNLSYFIKFKDF
jgi:hypothetical protein